jgi:hypothetical protein
MDRGHEFTEWSPIAPDLSALYIFLCELWHRLCMPTFREKNEELKDSYSRKVWKKDQYKYIECSTRK